MSEEHKYIVEWTAATTSTGYHYQRARRIERTELQVQEKKDMMTRDFTVVIGAGFGDEGKGHLTNYVFEKIGPRPRTIGVRFNGGAQAGHTVYHADETHVFHTYSSGSLRDPAPQTALTKDFIFNPFLFRMEYIELTDKTDLDKVLIDSRARVTSPFDMIINQAVERQRGGARHGSCGAGIFETVQRHEKHPLTARQIFTMADSDIDTWCDLVIDKYYERRASELITDPTMLADTIKLLHSNKARLDFQSAMEFARRRMTLSTFMDLYDSGRFYVFEGAQGLMLDQNNTEMFPHLTPSNCGLQNVYETIRELDECFGDMRFEITVIYVTRAYQTRHGAGPLNHEFAMPEYVIDPTNAPNDWQGTLRFGAFNFDQYEAAIERDLVWLKKIMELGRCDAARVQRAITCIDQIEFEDEVPFVRDGELQVVHGQEFIEMAHNHFSLFSKGTTWSDIYTRSKNDVVLKALPGEGETDECEDEEGM